MKVALVHDWLTGMRGGEKCLEVFCEIFPHADLYTLIYFPDRASSVIRNMKVHASWMNHLPSIGRDCRYCRPLFPRTIERFALRDYDLVLSSSHCVAKGVSPGGALHIAYLHAPMRYVWDMHDLYFGSDAGFLAKLGMRLSRKYLQQWDLRSSERVHFYLANSNNVAAKIKELYRREATVIHPPVDIERFYLSQGPKSYFLIVSALVPYKRIDIAVDAFNELKLPLKIAGDGPLRKMLEERAGPNIEFLGWAEGRQLADLYACCQAFILPGEEEFGIAALEAQASGRPVLAYARGGVLETVVALNVCEQGATSQSSATGIFFDQPSACSLIAAVEEYQKRQQLFDPGAIRLHASSFSRGRFKERIRSYVEARLREREAVE